MTESIATVDELLAFFPGVRHDAARTCPGCGADLSTTALVKLAYVFTGCDCDRIEYGHLYEQLWHIDCLRKPVE